ncbi:uncharacterized protein LOC121263545 isoform X2 [Juglans microcarpa x Juglans regia]|uniref:uncharacterized protein LOC121263545 isoform X2 n=1 Tax=Juglans microcarpa x Juglans regia TaxID=2249226 RepID=UPI001B7DE6B3|nr:uncharacterized protein LOC121263545 isoform X2 [Juglans microcarpa x Juglans regia]
MAAEDGEPGFGEGKLCLPSHDHDVPDKAGDRKEHTRQRLLIQYYHHQPHGQHHRRRSSPPEPFPQHLKSIGRSPQLGTNGASGGPGMQAFFLESAGRRSCGTGVFLPQRTGTNVPQSSKKPACSPVLLPNRVVQALNLNVHALGLHMSAPRQDNKCNHKAGRDCISNKKKNGKELPAQCYVISQNRNSSPEIFLPKEWTY